MSFAQPWDFASIGIKKMQGFGHTGASFEPGGFHDGVDYAMAQGTPLYAIADGIAHIDQNWTLPGHPVGWALHLKMPSGYTATYGHISRFAVSNGQQLHAGDLIGYSGGTPGTPGAGDSTGPHLHFELDTPGSPLGGGAKFTIDPSSLIQGLASGNVSDSVLGSGSVLTGANLGLQTAPTGADIKSGGFFGGLDLNPGDLVTQVSFIILGIVLLVAAVWYLARPGKQHIRLITGAGGVVKKAARNPAADTIEAGKDIAAAAV